MKNSWKSPTAGGALIVLLTAAAYIPAMRGGFIWDDGALITDNQLIRARDGLCRFWFTTEPDDYWPLTSSAWWLEWRLWGNNATGYHVVNVLLHAANAILVWMILRRLEIPGAWLAALVFAIHPVNVATVAWISEQKNTQSMFFFALAILSYLRFDEQGRWRLYGFSLAAFLLALLSKAAVVMLPVVLLGCVWWRRGSLRRKDLLYSLPFFALSLILGLVTVWFQYHRAMTGQSPRTDSFLSRLAVAGWTPWFYLFKALLPFNLTAVYPKWEINTSLWLSYLPGMVLVGCLAVFWWKRKTWGRPLLFALGYCVVTLFPVLGFFNQSFHRYSFVADHWQYYSIIGAIALVVAAATAICRRTGEPGRYLGVAASVVILTVLGVAAWRRGCVYADEQTLWRDNVAKNPNAWYAHNRLGVALKQVGKLQDATGHFEQALRIKADYSDAHYNIGLALSQVGKIKEAIGHYEQGLRITPNDPVAHYNLGVALEREGRVQEAVGQWEQALEIKPEYPEAHNNLGTVFLQAGGVQDAIRHYEQALQLKPDYVEAHNNLGIALVELGRTQEAIEHYQQALRIQPDYARAHCNLGLALEKLGRTPEAIQHYEQALRIKPDFANVLNSLARLLATLSLADGGEPSRAVDLAQRACELSGNRTASYLDTLAIAYAATGRFDDAVGTEKEAIEMARSDRQAKLVGEMEARLQLYRSGHAYRQSTDATSPQSPLMQGVPPRGFEAGRVADRSTRRGDGSRTW